MTKRADFTEASLKRAIRVADATAIEVYPPQADVVDEADMFHIWVLRGKLPFGLHKPMALPGLRSPVVFPHPTQEASHDE